MKIKMFILRTCARAHIKIGKNNQPRETENVLL